MQDMNNIGNNIGRKYSKKELDFATDFAHFLYELWIKSRKGEIIKVDKTNYDNEEPNNSN